MVKNTISKIAEKSSDDLSAKKVAKKVGRPSKSGHSHQTVRDRLIWCGTALLTEKGFNSTGIEEILKQVNVPKGSFYHYFKNKEGFGEAVIDNYADYFSQKLDRHLSNDSLPALQRLQSFIQEIKQGMAKYQYQRGCLVGNMGQELANSNDKFRMQLEAVFQTWQQQVSNCLQLAQIEGTLANDANCDYLAEFFWIGWEGAVLRSKLTRNDQPLTIFSTQFFALLPVQIILI